MRPVAFETAARVLDRLVPVVAGVRRVAGALAVAGVLAGALIGWALFANGLPDDGGSLAGRLLLLGLAFAPAVVLSMMWFALGEVIETPARLRRLPESARSHAGELERALRDLDGSGSRSRRPVTALWRLAKLPATARDSLMIYAPLTALVSVPFLVACAFSALVIPVELLVAVIVVAFAA